MDNNTNRQAQRSRTWIFDALMELLEEQPYDSITISQITQRAAVARQTFYRHYQDKDAVILDYLMNIFLENTRNVRNTSGNYVDLLNTFYEHRHTLLKLSHAGLINLLMNLTEPVCDYLDSLLLEKNIIFEPKSFECYLMKFEVGGLLAFLVSWINDGFEGTPSAMGASLECILQPYRCYDMYLPDFFIPQKADYVDPK